MILAVHVQRWGELAYADRRTACCKCDKGEGKGEGRCRGAEKAKRKMLPLGVLVVLITKSLGQVPDYFLLPLS